MSVLNKLINKSVLSVQSGIDVAYPINVEDKSPVFDPYIQLNFEEFTLNIYYPGNLNGVVDQSFKILETLKIIMITEEENEVCFNFENGISFNVNINPETIEGIEAMVLWGPNELCVVWN